MLAMAMVIRSTVAKRSKGTSSNGSKGSLIKILTIIHINEASVR